MADIKDPEQGLERLRDFVLWRRKPRQWRQQTVADRTGLSQSWVASLESGRLKGFPLDETLMKLAKGIALPGETPGSLYGFLSSLESNDFGPELIAEVAEGVKLPDAALHWAQTWPTNEPPPPVPEGNTPALLLARQTRVEGQTLVLKLLKRDLPPDDFQAARRFIDLLYAQCDLADGLPAPCDDSDYFRQEDNEE